MAKYNVYTESLSNAGENFGAFAADMNSLRERLISVLAGLPGEMSDIRRSLALTAEVLNDISQTAREMGMVVRDVSGIYLQAERVAFDEKKHVNPVVTTASGAVTLPPIRTQSGLTTFGGLVLPGWLQAATLRYGQSGGGNGG